MSPTSDVRPAPTHYRDRAAALVDRLPRELPRRPTAPRRRLERRVAPRREPSRGQLWLPIA